MTLVMLQSPLCFCLKMPLFLQEPFLQPCRSSLRLQPHPSLCHHLPTLYSGQPLLFLQWSLPGLGTSCSQGPSRLSPLLSYSAGPSQPSTASSPWRCLSSTHLALMELPITGPCPPAIEGWSRYGHVTEADHWRSSLRLTVRGSYCSSGGFK